MPVPMLLSPAESGQNLYTVNTVFHWWAEAPPEFIVGLDNYHEQSHRCYSSDQKRKCGPVVLEPMFAHATSIAALARAINGLKAIIRRRRMRVVP